MNKEQQKQIENSNQYGRYKFDNVNNYSEHRLNASSKRQTPSELINK